MSAGVNVRVKLVDVIVMTVSKYSRSDRFKAILCCASLSLPFLQSQRQRKMAARFFLHGDHLAKVVLSGTPLQGPCNAKERSLDPCNMIELSLTPCNTEIY